MQLVTGQVCAAGLGVFPSGCVAVPFRLSVGLSASVILCACLLYAWLHATLLSDVCAVSMRLYPQEAIGMRCLHQCTHSSQRKAPACLHFRKSPLQLTTQSKETAT